MEISIVLMTLIAFAALISVLSFAFNFLLAPIKAELSQLKTNQAKIDIKLDKLLANQSK